LDTHVSVAAEPALARRSTQWVLLPLTVGALVALTVGVIAKTQQDTSPSGYFELFFSDPIHVKAWFATAAGVLAFAQLFTAVWMFQRLPLERSPRVNFVHRWTGRLAFLFTLPVAYHCVFKVGFQTGDDRALVHSLVGSAFFGAYAAKVLIVKMKRYPVWVIPTAGGLLFTTLIVVVWYTSALWFFSLVGEGY
jgi:ABC-type uncharacterized transport system permease subunit